MVKAHQWADVIFENNICLRLAWPASILQKPKVIALRTWIARSDGSVSKIDQIKLHYLKFARQVIAVSDKVRQKSWTKAHVIGNPYRINLFNRKTSIKKDRDFVFMGRLVSDKGADMAIKAIFELIKSDYRDITLTLVGNGPEMENLQALAKDLNIKKNIQFTGALKGENLVNCLNEHKYILVPSVWEEPFGNVVLEGMACGCLPIVSNGGGLPDAVGQAGIIFERGNLKDMVTVILNLLSSKEIEDKIRKKMPEHLKEHHPAKVAKKYLDIIQSAVNN
ncbi:MAG: glycosyltransferase family 4 protein [Candidatus Cyclobacteriaceae bacterium M3_2C_046]